MKQLEGTVVIVTGASRGIGRLIALAMGEAGARVAVVARSSAPGKRPQTIEATAAEIMDGGGIALPIRCDVTKARETVAMAKQVMDAFGRIDVLVNNAAIYPRVDFLDMSLASWRRHLDVNLTGAFLCCKAVVPHMIQRGAGGSIINLGSGVANAATVSGLIAYSTSKAGLARFTTALAQELLPHDIAVNNLDPGAIRTEGVEDYILRQGKDPLDKAGYYWFPAEPSVIGPAVTFLAQQRS
ncbi:MAG: SDR family oxidoreductase, partial [Chloroflexi bacterium]|nr:SDR family oxidoreductase [Chloroflexota bacterium]